MNLEPTRQQTREAAEFLGLSSYDEIRTAVIVLALIVKKQAEQIAELQQQQGEL